LTSRADDILVSIACEGSSMADWYACGTLLVEVQREDIR
jgi:hypothetical protein